MPLIRDELTPTNYPSSPLPGRRLSFSRRSTKPEGKFSRGFIAIRGNLPSERGNAMEGERQRRDTAPGAAKQNVGIYDSAEDALKELFEAFNYWSSQVTSTSVQMCYALIGANWVVFGSVGHILQNRWAIASLATVLLALALNTVSSLGFAEWMRCRFESADKDRRKWQKEFGDETLKHSLWPYTKRLNDISIALRYAKVLLPLSSGVLLILGAVL